MQTNIRKWGNSQGLCIPRSMLFQLGWSLQEDVEVEIAGERIIIEKRRPQSVKAAAFDKIKEMRKPADDFDAKEELKDYLEERYGDK